MSNRIYNPYLPVDEFMPDAEPHIFNNRVYMYGSHDTGDGQDYCLEDYISWSAPVEDLSDWRYEGIIFKRTQDPTNPEGDRYMQAPDCIQGPDGKYYLYYVLSVPKWDQLQICVAVCDEPAGEYQYLGVVSWPCGKKLDTSLPFDPAVLVDEDERVWLYFGFAPNFPMRGQPIPETMGAYCVELEKDMLTVKGEPFNIMPDFKHAQGTEFEEHPFFEAASIRKYDGMYYFVYCSSLMHELCLATSDKPDRDFHFKGVVVSNCDVGFEGRELKNARNQMANIHGGLLKIDDRWYIAYHRHTHGRQFSRQGCMERVYFNADGTVRQSECTSFGLSDGCVPAKGTIPAWCACNMYKGEGGKFIRFSRERTVDGPIVVVSGEEGYVEGINDTSVVGFRYLQFEGDESSITLTVRGQAEGEIELMLSDADDAIADTAKMNLDTDKWTDIDLKIPESCGKLPLRIRYQGNGSLELLKITIK